jgi:hypothetical protein
MGGNVARATSPAGAVRTEGRFLEPDRARGGLWRQSERFRVAERSSNRVRDGRNALDRDRVWTETDRKPAPNSPDAVIWERSEYQGHMTSPVVVKGHAYLLGRDRRLACFDLAAGKEAENQAADGLCS